MIVALIVVSGLLLLESGFVAYRVMQGQMPAAFGLGRSIVQLTPRIEEIRAQRALIAQMLRGMGRTGMPKVRTRDAAEVLEEGQDLLVVAFATDTGRGVTRSIEAVRFYGDERVTFRHLRSPFPHAFEEFALEQIPGGTRLHYRGEFGVDLWFLGRAAARLYLKPNFDGLVDEHLAALKEAAEARGARSRVFPTPNDQ